jgi:membrane protein YdbS with pleckstrin-like domain
VFSPTVDRPRLPSQVSNYILPGENVIVLVRRHWASIGGSLVLFVGSLLVAIVVTFTVAAGQGAAQEVVWVLWLIVFGYCAWRYIDWRITYFAVTKKRLLLVTGVLSRSIATLPLTKVTDMKVNQSFTGRSLEYATYIVESAGQDQALRTIRFVPYPQQLYLEIMSMIFPDLAEPLPPGGDDTSGTPAEDDPGF